MLVKVIIVFFLLLILYSLGSALFYLVKGRDDIRVVQALTWRIGLSIFLFILLFLAYYFGLIKPHQI